MYARLGEIVGLDGSIAVTLAAHQAIGLKVKYLGMLSMTPEDLQEVNCAWEEGLACTCLLALQCLVCAHPFSALLDSAQSLHKQWLFAVFLPFESPSCPHCL